MHEGNSFRLRSEEQIEHAISGSWAELFADYDLVKSGTIPMAGARSLQNYRAARIGNAALINRDNVLDKEKHKARLFKKNPGNSAY